MQMETLFYPLPKIYFAKMVSDSGDKFPKNNVHQTKYYNRTQSVNQIRKNVKF